MASDDTTDAYQYTGCTSLGDTLGIPAYVNTLPGHSGTNGVNYADASVADSLRHADRRFVSGFVVLSLALAASQGKETVTLNGQFALLFASLGFNSDAVERSGLSGYTQWIAFQWPTSALNAAGTDNVITTQ